MKNFVLLIILTVSGAIGVLAAEKKTVVWVDAYHPELEWSAGILEGIESVFEEAINDGSLALETLYLDTKNHPGEAFAIQAAQSAKEAISLLDPDVLIAGDDATAKYLIQKYYAGTDLPVVFCGVNFNAEKYGIGEKGGAPNVTGIVEVPPIDVALKTVAKYAKGTRYGYVTFDDLSERGNFDGIVNQLGIQIPDDRVAFVSTLDDWKRAYRRLQREVDIIIMGSANFMQGWDWAGAHQFVLQQTSKETAIPVTYNRWTIDIALLAYSKRATEQGEWAARAALAILFQGKKPSDIPIGRNQEADLLLNQTLATHLGIAFEPDDREKGTIVITPIN